MEPSILSSVGADLLPILSPISICMLLVVAVISTIHPPSESVTSAPMRTATTLVYLESPSDCPAQKLQGALLNAAAFIALITFLLILLYYYNSSPSSCASPPSSSLCPLVAPSFFSLSSGSHYPSMQSPAFYCSSISLPLGCYRSSRMDSQSFFDKGIWIPNHFLTRVYRFPIIFQQRWRRIVYFFFINAVSTIRFHGTGFMELRLRVFEILPDKK